MKSIRTAFLAFAAIALITSSSAHALTFDETVAADMRDFDVAIQFQPAFDLQSTLNQNDPLVAQVEPAVIAVDTPYWVVSTRSSAPFVVTLAAQPALLIDLSDRVPPERTATA